MMKVPEEPAKRFRKKKEPTMEIRNLKTFLRVAALRNFTAAAKELGYSQANVSAQIKQLEEEVGAPLFDRIGRGVAPTQYAEALLPHARAIINSAAQMENLFKPPTMQTPLNDYPLQHVPTGLPVIFVIIHTEVDYPDFRRDVEHPFAGMIRRQNPNLIPWHLRQSVRLGDSNPLDSPNIIYTIDAIGYPHITLLSTQPWLPIQQPDTSGNKQLYDVVYSTSDAISEGGMP